MKTKFGSAKKVMMKVHLVVPEKERRTPIYEFVNEDNSRFCNFLAKHEIWCLGDLLDNWNEIIRKPIRQLNEDNQKLLAATVMAWADEKGYIELIEPKSWAEWEKKVVEPLNKIVRINMQRNE